MKLEADEARYSQKVFPVLLVLVFREGSNNNNGGILRCDNWSDGKTLGEVLVRVELDTGLETLLEGSPNVGTG